MFFSTKDLGARSLVMVLVITTLSLTEGASICSGYDGQREHCGKQRGICQWNRRQNKCLLVPTWEKCAEKTKRLQCRKQGCVWNESDSTCVSTRPLLAVDDQAVAKEDSTGREVIIEEVRKPSLRSLNVDEDLRPQTRPLFLDEDRENSSNVDEDLRPQTRPLFLDEDRENPSNVDEDLRPQTRPLFFEDRENPSNAGEDVEVQTRPLFLGEDRGDPLDENEENWSRPLIINGNEERPTIDDKEKNSSLGEEVEDLHMPAPISNGDEKGQQVENPIVLDDEDVDEDEESIDDVSVESDPIIIDGDVPEKEAIPTISYLNEEAPIDRAPITNLDKEAPVPLPQMPTEVSRDADGIPLSEKSFWSKTRNKNVKKVKEQIENEFGDRYNVVVCRKKNPRPECNVRNKDFSRVRIWVRKQTRVKKVVIG